MSCGIVVFWTKSNIYLYFVGFYFILYPWWVFTLLVTWSIVAHFSSLFYCFNNLDPIFISHTYIFFRLILGEEIPKSTLFHNGVRNPRPSLYIIYIYIYNDLALFTISGIQKLGVLGRSPVDKERLLWIVFRTNKHLNTLLILFYHY